MYTNLYFDNTTKLITAYAYDPENPNRKYSATHKEAHLAINRLCDEVEKDYDRVVSGEIMLYLRNLYYRIMSAVINFFGPKAANIWNTDCNQIANTCRLSGI